MPRGDVYFLDVPGGIGWHRLGKIYPDPVSPEGEGWVLCFSLMRGDTFVWFWRRDAGDYIDSALKKLKERGKKTL